MAELAREAWALAGHALPRYSRNEVPIRLTTLAEL